MTKAYSLPSLVAEWSSESQAAGHGAARPTGPPSGERVQGMVASRQKMALEHKQAHGGLVYLLSSVDFQLGNSQQKVSNRRKGC